MVDNINLNKITPLLSSTERIKKVDRKARNNQQSPFEGDQHGKKKKKKKKKEGEDVTLSEVFSSGNNPSYVEPAVKHRQEKETDSKTGRRNKIIDIRV